MPGIMNDNTSKLKQIRDEVYLCQKCSLYKTRQNPVVGEGNHQAEIVFVGEAPGAQEDKTAHPFCGASGKFLSELLGHVGIKREEVYIANLLKCRPPGNRDPDLFEIETCAAYLQRQIMAINPRVLCSLGRYSTAFLMEKLGLGKELKPISQIHGRVFVAKEWLTGINFIPFFHPAVAVYNSGMKESLRADFEVFKKLKLVL